MGGGAEVDFPAVMDRMDGVIAAAGEHDSPERFRGLGVDVFEDEARFEAPDLVAVDGRRLEARSVIVATGSHPTAPPVEGLEEAGYLTNVGALRLRRLPRSLVIVGSGPVGSEFAQIFARFGSDVTLVSTSPLPLPKEDPEIGEVLRQVLLADGVAFHGGYSAEKVRVENGEKVMTAKNGAGHEIEARGEEILVAAGRAPTAGSLGLENAGIELEKKGLRVDERLRTTAPNVYAAGDITGKYLFTHVAEYQARNALRNALFPVKAKADHRVVPWTTFTDPEVARVGLTEEQARRRARGRRGLPPALRRGGPGDGRRGDYRARQARHRQAGEDPGRPHHRPGRGEPDPRDSPRHAEEHPHRHPLHDHPRLPHARPGEPAGRGQLLPREALPEPNRLFSTFFGARRLLDRVRPPASRK